MKKSNLIMDSKHIYILNLVFYFVEVFWIYSYQTYSIVDFRYNVTCSAGFLTSLRGGFASRVCKQ